MKKSLGFWGARGWKCKIKMPCRDSLLWFILMVTFAVLSVANWTFSVGLLPHPSISVDGKVCMQATNRVAVPDMPGPKHKMPTEQDRVDAIVSQLREATFRPVEGFKVPVASGEPNQAILQGRVLVKVGDYWGVSARQVRLRRDSHAIDEWRIDVDALLKTGQHLPTKGL